MQSNLLMLMTKNIRNNQVTRTKPMVWSLFVDVFSPVLQKLTKIYYKPLSYYLFYFLSLLKSLDI